MDRKKFVSFIAVSVFSAGIMASAAPIKGIHFEGLKKTKEFVIQRDLKNYIGAEDSDEIVHVLETQLQSAGLFSEINIEKTPVDDGTELTVKVKEKISFLAVPMAMVSSGSVMGGAFVLDSNAFGLRDLVVLGGFFSKSEIRGIWMFSKPPVGHVPGFSFFGSAGKKNQIFKNLADEEVIDYNMISANSGITITEQINGIFSASMGVNFGFKNFDEKDQETIENNKFMEFKPALRLSHTDWNGVFLSTKTAELTYGAVVYTSHYVWHTFSPRILFQQPVLVNSFRINVNINGFHTKYAPYSAYQGNNTLGVNILPSKFGTGSGIGGSAGVEYAALRTRIGTFSVYGAYQCAYVEDLNEEYKVNQGAAAGIQMYLKQLAVPAMSFGMTFNATEKRFGGFFTLGMSF